MESQKNIVQCYGKDCMKCPDRCQWYACGMDVIREKKETLAIANGTRGVLSLDGMQSENGNKEKLSADFMSALEIPPEEASAGRKTLLDAINRMAFLYIESPRIFDALIQRIYLRRNQSDIARSRGVTRAAVSKELRQGITNMMTRELGLRTPVAKREKLLELTPKEFAVYKILFLDGCTVRSAAVQLGMSKSKVSRMGQILRRKLGKNGTCQKRLRKKS